RAVVITHFNQEHAPVLQRDGVVRFQRQRLGKGRECEVLVAFLLVDLAERRDENRVPGFEANGLLDLRKRAIQMTTAFRYQCAPVMRVRVARIEAGCLVKVHHCAIIIAL
ncbi:unnamed protein product, partial [Phaeothamnion confervicola]